MTRFTFLASSVLAAIGTAMGLYGIVGERFSSFMCGLVMIAGGGVFAVLYVGMRASAVKAFQKSPD